MPILQGIVITTEASGLAPSAAKGTTDDINPSSGQAAPPEGGWSAAPTSVDPNRPDYSTTVVPYSTATPNQIASSIPAAAAGGSINTAALVGITVSAGIVIMTVVFAIIWWTRERSKSHDDFGHGQQPIAAEEEEEEKPPTYEAAVFGIYRNDQTSPPHHIPQQSFPVPLSILQAPLPTHHIHSPRPFNATTANGTLHRLDTTVPPPRDITQHADIVIYPHDSPPQTPVPPTQQNALPIRSSQINFNRESGEILPSHHIIDFSEDYPDTVSFNSDFSDSEPAAVREIV